VFCCRSHRKPGFAKGLAIQAQTNSRSPPLSITSSPGSVQSSSRCVRSSVAFSSTLDALRGRSVLNSIFFSAQFEQWRPFGSAQHGICSRAQVRPAVEVDVRARAQYFATAVVVVDRSDHRQFGGNGQYVYGTCQQQWVRPAQQPSVRNRIPTET